MRRKNQEITNYKNLELILKKSEVVRLAIMDGNRPYIVPLNYGYHNNHLYIHCANAGKKLDLLRKNNKVCFEVEERAEIIKHSEACDWSTTYKSIIGYGEIEIVEDFDEKIKGLDIIMLHLGSTDKNEYNPTSVNAVSILKLKITEMTGKMSKNLLDNS